MTRPALADFKAWRSERSPGFADDQQLTRALAFGLRFVEDRIGPLTSQAFTVSQFTTGGDVFLSQAPRPTSVTSVTPHRGSSRADVVEWVNPDRWVVRLRHRGSWGPWSFTGTHGWAVAPAGSWDAVFIAANWDLRSRGQAQARAGTSDESRAGLPYAANLIAGLAPPAVA